MRQPSIKALPSDRRQTVSAYVLAYLYWLASTVLGAYFLFMLHGTILAVWLAAALIGQQPTASQIFYTNLQVRAADTGLTVFLGAVLVIGIVTFESVFRNYGLNDNAYQLFLKIALWECGLAAMAAVLTMVAEIEVNGYHWSSLNDPILSILGAAFVAWHWKTNTM